MFELFPPSALDHSILTSVLVGLLILWFFQETLGWGFSGLVVPGYLATILAFDPATAAVVSVEALLTWLIYSGLSELIPRRWLWSRFFGRDRFFGLLVVSVGVRLLLEGAAFDLLLETTGWQISGGLHAMGLVLVPLLANALWRAGPVTGLLRVGLPVFLTWLVLKVVLLDHTNLSLANFELSYEDLALDFRSSPRAYVLLLTGAWIGSQMNLRYGWDYGGILVPGLLALCWLKPMTVFATVFEALFIAMLLSVALRLPGLRGANLTGGRPLVLGFALAWLAKFALGWALMGGIGGLRTHELFGFGYLLPTLMALRIAKFGDPFRSLLPTLLTSAGGFVVGSVIGYGLAVALPVELERGTPPPSNPGEVRAELLLAALQNDGTPPVRPGLLVASRQEALVFGGDGFGGLWVRGGEREPLVLVARVGPPGLGAAALSLAEALNVRAVLLCGATGPACEVAAEDIHAYTPTLWLTGEERSKLRAKGEVPAALDFSVIGRLGLGLDSAVEHGPLTLALSEGDRLRVAAASAELAPSPLQEVLSAPRGRLDGVAPEQRAARLAELHALDELVLGPWRAWLTGADGADVALRVAASNAATLGLRIGVDGEHSAVVGPDWLVEVRRGQRGPILLAPAVEEEPGVEALARALQEALDGAALVLDSPPTAPQGLPDTARPAHAALEAVARALGDQPSLVVVRGFRDTLDAGADVVLSTGRPAPDLAALPQPGPRLADLLAGLGLSVAPYDGSLTRLSFLDPGNEARGLVDLAAGRPASVTLFASAEVRERVTARGLAP